jgi:hypothetical protein
MNPALRAFLDSIDEEVTFGQARIRRIPNGFELRHVNDTWAGVRPMKPTELRATAQFTASGAFRPLKSAPTLRQGWRVLLPNEEALGRALDDLYPGAVADWFAAQAKPPPVTSYRAFTERQTGMYRI